VGARRAVPVLLAALTCAGCASLPRPELGWPGAARKPELVVVEGSAVNLPVPRDPRASSGELRRVPLRWDPVLTGDVAGYRVERAEADTEEWQPVATVPSRFGTTWVDGGDPREGGEGRLGDGARYAYRVRPFDSGGSLARVASKSVTATTAPLPKAPPGLRVYSHLPREVAITWHPVSDPTVAGYVLLRSPSAAGPFEPIVRLDGRFATRHQDRRLGDLRVFYYRVAAYNTVGAVGEATPPVVAVTKAEPLPPIGLRLVEQRLGENRLAWEPNVEGDVAGYRLLRYRAGRRGAETVATPPAAATTAVDADLAADEVVAYALEAFDADGLASDTTDRLRVVSEGYRLAAEVRDGAVHLRWDPVADAGFTSARVFREGWLRRREIGRASEGGFVDADVEPGGTYRYVVVLEHGDGRRAPPSTPLEVRVEEAEAR
jgi:hypothetical protein